MKKHLIILSLNAFILTSSGTIFPKNNSSFHVLGLKLSIERLQARMNFDKTYGDDYTLGLSQLAHPGEYFRVPVGNDGVLQWCDNHLIAPYEDVKERTDDIQSRLHNMPQWFKQQDVKHFADAITHKADNNIKLLDDYKKFLTQPHTPEERDAKIQSLQKDLSYNNGLINQAIVAIDHNFWNQFRDEQEKRAKE